jgi:hypothetical protein
MQIHSEKREDGKERRTVVLGTIVDVPLSFLCPF